MKKKHTPKKTLILAIDVGKGKSDWMIRAMQMQISDWFNQNQTILPAENLVIFPASGETKLYWLEGDPEDIKDVEKLEEIKDRIKPVLELALGIKSDPNKKYKHPKVSAPEQNTLKKAMEDLEKRRRQGPPKPRIIRP